MSIIEKLDKLASMDEIKDENKIKAYNTLLNFSEYISLVVSKNIELSIYSLEDEKAPEEIEEKYEECIEGIVFLNSLSEKYLGERIYDKELNRNEVERFMQKIIDEIFRNRKIRR